VCHLTFEFRKLILFSSSFDHICQQDDPGPPLRQLLPPGEAAAILRAANGPFMVALRLTHLVAAIPDLPESIRVSPQSWCPTTAKVQSLAVAPAADGPDCGQSG